MRKILNEQNKSLALYIADLQFLLANVSIVKVGLLSDSRKRSLQSLGLFSLNLLTRHLALTFPLNKDLFSALWNCKRPKGINILIWIMLTGSLNCSEVLQRTLLLIAFLHLFVCFCCAAKDSLQHKVFNC